MFSKILIIGSTGTLGSKLLDYCSKNLIKIHGITCFKNTNKLLKQKIKFKIIYFLDYGSQSLRYLDLILKNNVNLTLAIANKEMLIAGGSFLIKRINDTRNNLIPLDSEHFSLYRANPDNSEVKKIYITASGGPFYFQKKINLNNVSLQKVLAHPKWKMGINNSIDSSNFINKILEIYELSVIYNIDIEKIDFLVSKEAFIHSLVIFNDNTISINCFTNNMLISLVKPLTLIFKSKEIYTKYNNLLDANNFNLIEFNDKRFKVNKYFNKIKKFNHKEQINFMILNNIAHKKYLNGEIKYDQIFDFIMKKAVLIEKEVNFKSFNDILSYISLIENKHA